MQFSRKADVLSSVALVLSLIGCIDRSSPLAPSASTAEARNVAHVVTTPAKAHLIVDSIVALHAVVEDSAGNAVNGAYVFWHSSDTTVAIVSPAGNVRALREGAATISAYVGKVNGASAVTTTAIVDSVRMSAPSATLQVGKTTQLTAQATDSKGRKLNRTVTWSSSDPTVASVSSSGVITALKTGTTTIDASVLSVSGSLVSSDTLLSLSTNKGSGGKKLGHAKITVTPLPVSSLLMSPATVSLGIGATAQVAATPLDSSGKPVSGYTVTWSSANSAVATVSSTGLVKGAAFGSTTVIATVNGVKGSAAANVVPVGAEVPSVNPAFESLLTGQSAQVTAVLKDSTGNVISGATFTWATSNSSVAKVTPSSSSSSATISAVGAGSASITATANGSKAAVSVVVNLVPVATVSVSPSSLSLTAGGTGTFAATARDSTGGTLTGRTVTWTSSNTGIASVSAGGVVTAVAAGTATISATIDGKSGSGSVAVTAPAPVTSPSPTPTPTTSPDPTSGSAVGPQSSLNPTTGVVIQPGQSIQAAVNANPSGTTFWLKAGTWHQQSVVPKDGMTFAGEAGAILDGDNTTVKAFSGTASRVTIRNLVVQNYNTPLQAGAIQGDWTASLHWLVEYCEIRTNHAAGLYATDSMIARNNYIHHNGQIGILGKGNGALFTGNEVSYNNTGGNDPDWEAGGMKFLYSTGLRFADNYVHDNYGPGIWFDGYNNGNLIEGNRVVHNQDAGIFYEISYNAVIRNNTVTSNGGNGSIARAGILVSASSGVEVYGNTLSDNSNGVIGLQANRGTAPAQYDAGPLLVQNLYVHDNQISMNRGLTGLVDQVGDGGIFTRNNRFEHNTYSVSLLSRPFSGPGGSLTPAQWQAAGFDLTSIFQ
ncbi:MAG TPA: Ig-like domain-containing protein [Gemmatimonadaceae bacterium]|jgi:parallel beta-helix repeat protein